MKKTICFCLFFLINTVVNGQGIKNPNVAGGFYPSNPKELSSVVDGFISQANNEPNIGQVDVAIVPHAGYVFSGAVAGFGYKLLSKRQYSTVIVLGPSHFYPFDGAAIWPKGGFQTPLGVINVDEEISANLIKASTSIQDKPEVFNQEHAIEVQLPFIQRTWPHAKIVPMLLGNPDFKVCEQIALVLNALIGKREDVLVLVSSDLSHYLPYKENNERDVRTLEAIKAFDVEGFFKGNLDRSMEMCGFVPTTVAMMLAKLRGLSITTVLKHANSGDVTDDKARVVGYASIIFTKPSGLNQKQQQQLLTLARASLESFVHKGQRFKADVKDSRLNQIQGAFVTLTENGQLRGCIGNIIGQQPLAQTVADMAVAAASNDPRFPPVKPEELKDIHVEISVLSVPQRISDTNQIQLGLDGVIISSDNNHQGVFLPQVATETGWSKEEFLKELCSQKAGLDANCYLDKNIMMYTFTAEVFDEK